MEHKLTRKYILDKSEQTVIFRFLNGELTSREASKLLNRTHQSVINLTCALCRQWFQEGKLTLKPINNSK